MPSHRRAQAAFRREGVLDSVVLAGQSVRPYASLLRFAVIVSQAGSWGAEQVLSQSAVRSRVAVRVVRMVSISGL